MLWGPAGAGKETLLEALYRSTPAGERGRLVRVAVNGDQVLLFERRERHAAPPTRIVVYTLSGPDAHETNLRRVLDAADAVVLVVGASAQQAEGARACLERLDAWLRERGRDPRDLELFLEYNQRDRPDAVPVDELNARLNAGGAAWGEAVATRGEGVNEAFSRVLEALEARPHGRRSTDVAPPRFAVFPAAGAAGASTAHAPEVTFPRARTSAGADVVPIPVDADQADG